jgi:hypothetical protein
VYRYRAGGIPATKVMMKSHPVISEIFLVESIWNSPLVELNNRPGVSGAWHSLTVRRCRRQVDLP